MVTPRKIRPFPKIVERELEASVDRAEHAIAKARGEVAKAKKLVHKSFAVQDRARAARAKKRA